MLIYCKMWIVAIILLILLLFFEINRQRDCYKDQGYHRNAEKKWFKRNNIYY